MRCSDVSSQMPTRRGATFQALTAHKGRRDSNVDFESPLDTSDVLRKGGARHGRHPMSDPSVHPP
ncbi:hypothetical protein [Brachybacterium sacelli]|uniref:hypothetical protein n=1 Tax=Brachybacterium sacelli TaxID=173364 RepID=UPI00360988D8